MESVSHIEVGYSRYWTARYTVILQLSRFKLYSRSSSPFRNYYGYATRCWFRKWLQMKGKESHAVARKPRDAAAVLFRLMFADNIHYKLRTAKFRKPGSRAPNIPAQKKNRI